MPIKSSLKELPENLRHQVDKMITTGDWTIDELVEYLESAGHPKSRSAVGRYKKNIDQVASKLRQSREITEALVHEMGPDATTGKQGKILTEILRSLIYDHLAAHLDDDAEGPAMDPKDFLFLSKALKDLAGTAKLDQDHLDRVRTEAAAAAQAEAAKNAGAAAKQMGLSNETIEAIRQNILGGGS